MTKLPASVDQRSDSPSSTAMQRAIRLLVPVLITLGMGSVLLWFARDAGVRSITFTFWANFFVLAWANGVQRVTRLSLGEWYYRCKRFEQDGRLYEWLGIRFCKRLLSSRVWRAFNPGFQFNQQGSRMLPALAQALRDAETGHALGFLGMSMLAGYAVSQRWWDTAGWLFLFNVFINGYPIMLQRYNRARLEHIRRRWRS